MTAHPLPARLDPGKVRSFQRVLTDDGFFQICAIDHLHDFVWLLNDDLDAVPFADTVRAKDRVIRAAAPYSSAILVDARYGIGHLVDSGAIPGGVGLITAAEDEGYTFPDGPRRTRLREGWGIEQSKLAGVDVVKLLWFYRPGTEASTDQVALVERLVAESTRYSLPLVVEPIWYPLPGEDPTSPAWQAGRYAGIVESAVLIDSLGVDLLKIEFPGDVSSEAGRAAARQACTELDARTTAPWVILSAGVGYDDFRVQLEIACDAGASGYLAGRSIWRDVVVALNGGDVEAALEAMRGRFTELNRITRDHGRPYVPGAPLDEVLAELPPDWYRTWHAG